MTRVRTADTLWNYEADGEPDGGYINYEMPGRYSVTLYGAYVGRADAYGRYPAALAALAEAIRELRQHHAYRDADIPSFYTNHQTGLMVPFPMRAEDVRADYDRPADPDVARWFDTEARGATSVEAFCLLCGEIFNPYGAEDMTHQTCGGPGVPVGYYR